RHHGIRDQRVIFARRSDGPIRQHSVMPLKLILMSHDGTVGADGKARIDILRELCTFIERMAARDVRVGIWSFHRQLLDGEPLETYLTRESEVPVRHFHADNAQYPVRQRSGSVEPIL